MRITLKNKSHNLTYPTTTTFGIGTLWLRDRSFKRSLLGYVEFVRASAYLSDKRYIDVYTVPPHSKDEMFAVSTVVL